MALGKCVECGREVSTSASSCPNCGKRKPTQTLGQKLSAWILTVLLVFVGGPLLCCGGLSSCADKIRNDLANSKPANRDGKDIGGGAESTQTWPWQVPGTLHDASAITWQRASDANKLATCADFVMRLKNSGLLADDIARNIGSMDSALPYATQLVSCIDAATKPEPNAEENRKVYQNQSVRDIGAACAISMGWKR